jgi:hypothetical protein
MIQSEQNISLGVIPGGGLEWIPSSSVEGRYPSNKLWGVEKYAKPYLLIWLQLIRSAFKLYPSLSSTL